MDDISDFLVAGPNLPFLIAGCIVAGLFILELAMLVIGHSMMLGHGDVDLTLDLNGNGIPDYLETGHFDLTGWMNPGHIPSSMFLVVFSGVFSLMGFSGQWIYDGLTGQLAPMLLSIPIAVAATLPIARMASVGIARAMPQEETNAVALESLQGAVGILTAGPVQGRSDFGMARFTDKHGVDHAVMVSGESEEIIETSSNVMLVGPHPDKAIAFIVRKI